ncbi:CatA-like O-acetyltransferase [Sagittula sp. S175]|uniref:CatA-like O-acetyltransferase n=1 Tax=Sagittula sp. S175 TaxID=3415129 RepID=UPI003C7DEC0D
MTATPIDLSTWDRTETFRWFRAYAQPHYGTTCRVDVTRLMTVNKPQGVSPYIGCLYAIGHGLLAVPQLRTRFRGDTVVQHDTIALSFTVPRDSGGFAYSLQPFDPDFATFDRATRNTIATVRAKTGLNATPDAGDGVAYLSCVPWLDFTALDHPLPGPEDCIPRVSWGKIVPKADGFDMAVNIYVHHALTDGEHLGQFYAALQDRLNTL